MTYISVAKHFIMLKFFEVEWIRGGRLMTLSSWPSTTYCASPSVFSPVAVLLLAWSAKFCLMGPCGNHLVSWSVIPSSKILKQLRLTVTLNMWGSFFSVVISLPIWIMSP
jgi:hypothetical protein